MSDLRSALGAAAAQDLFDAAANAGAKGNAQFGTPEKFGRRLAALLTPVRPVLLDPTAGDGALMIAARLAGTRPLAIELDPVAAAALVGTDGTRSGSVLPGDLTAIAPLLAQVGFECDAWVCNPPWDHHWYRENLAFLADGPAAVAEAFAAHDGRTPRECIDSTVATLCVALTLSSAYGEGFLVANENTLQRLLFAGDAPHAALLAHCWAHAVFPGSVFGTGQSDGISCPVGVLWFARGHSAGPREITAEMNAAEPNFRSLRLQRTGMEPRAYQNHWETALEHWETVRQEWTQRRAAAAGQAPPYHLFLLPDGTIGTRLNRFEDRTLDARRTRRLHDLNGRTPLSLVIQRTERTLLLDVTEREGWRVDPALTQAVARAVAEYHRVRAPLVPLNAVQRLGYLDEEDSILCTRDLTVKLAADPAETPPAPAPRLRGRNARLPVAAEPARPAALTFLAGQRYPIRTRTVTVSRPDVRFGFGGESIDILLTGQHLAIYLGTGEPGPVPGADPATCHPSPVTFPEACFMDDSVRSAQHTLGDDVRCDASLTDLVGHFQIPEVPDIATVDPAGYRQNLDFLTALEQLLTA